MAKKSKKKKFQKGININKDIYDKVSRVLTNTTVERICKKNYNEIIQDIKEEYFDFLIEIILEIDNEYLGHGLKLDYIEYDNEELQYVVNKLFTREELENKLEDLYIAMKNEILSSEDDITEDDRKEIRVAIAQMKLNTYTKMSQSQIMGLVSKSISYVLEEYDKEHHNAYKEKIETIIKG